MKEQILKESERLWLKSCDDGDIIDYDDDEVIGYLSRKWYFYGATIKRFRDYCWINDKDENDINLLEYLRSI